MATKPHASSEDQIAQLGRVRRKPVQIDLLTGNLAPKKIRVGRGDHIRLKPIPGEKSAIPGMAYFAGTGPTGKRCQHCRFLADIPVWGVNKSTPALAGKLDTTPSKRLEYNACRKACDMYEGVVQPGGIEFESACKYFEPKQAADV